MRRAVFAVFALTLSLVPMQSAYAQGAAPNLCQNTIFQAVAPLLMQANRFTPSGQFPQGFAPLTQPFGVNPLEYSTWGYPQQAYMWGYTAPAGMRMPGPGAPAIPGAAPGLATQLQLPPDQLTPAGIMQFLMDSGTWDRLSSTDQADWLLRLANLQRDQFNQYLGLANYQQNAAQVELNIRRAPFDISHWYQERAEQWRASYGFTADSVRNLLQATCNPLTGGIGLGTVGGFAPAGPNGAAIAGAAGAAALPGGGGLPGIFGTAGGLGGLGALCLSQGSPVLCPFGR